MTKAEFMEFMDWAKEQTMSDRLLKESDVLRAIDNRVKELSIDPQFVQKHGIIDVMGVKKHILAIPSADRPQGEWERIPYSLAGGYRCSICGQKSLENHWNFCPNCGAEMKGNR